MRIKLNTLTQYYKTNKNEKFKRIIYFRFENTI